MSKLVNGKDSKNYSDGGKGSLSNSNNSIYRYYTITIKPVYTPFKGDKKNLFSTFINWCKAVKYNSFTYVYEGENTSNLHIHALVECPLIKVLPCNFGYHIHKQIIRIEFNNEEDIKHIWKLYTSKELTSDSAHYHHLYGNMFIDQVE